MKKGFITGVTGQEGSYLAEFLLRKGYEVHGLVRRTSMFNRERIEHLIDGTAYSDRFITHYGDMTDGSSLIRVLSLVRPDEIYNLAAQSHVLISFVEPEYTVESDALGVLRLSEAVKSMNLHSRCRIYQASTSELYGECLESPQDEKTPFNPVSPYAAAKLYAYYISQCYRKAYGMYICNGILFNHESPRRGENFVSRKITLSLAKILSGRRKKITLGNLDSKRDWGYAGDFVEAMWLMLQPDKPEDYVIAAGETHSVREFAEVAFALCGIELGWRESGVRERGIDTLTGQEVPYLRGDSSKARKALGWIPRVTFRQLVEMMLAHDLRKFSVPCPFEFSAYEGVGR